MTDMSLEERKSALTAEGQGSEIPLGWVPTAAEPVPVVRCKQIKKDGERCKNWSIRGYTKCRKHSGPQALMPDGNVSKYIENMKEAAMLSLVSDADMAVDALKDFLAQPGTSESVKLKAATEILDRVGVRGGFEVSVDGNITVDAGETVAERLAALKSGALAVEEMKRKALAKANGEDPDADPDIVDGEIVSDPEQETLF